MEGVSVRVVVWPADLRSPDQQGKKENQQTGGTQAAAFQASGEEGWQDKLSGIWNPDCHAEIKKIAKNAKA